MNAATDSANDFILDHSASDSDTDTDEEHPEYYQPISAVPDDHDEELHFSDRYNSNSDGGNDVDQFNSFNRPLPNGYTPMHCVENGVASLDLSDDDDVIDEEGEEEERTVEESDVAIQRAFRDDERRRNAPLTPENAVRVMEAMRGVSFGGLAPDWVGRIPRDQWIDELRRIRRPAASG